MKKKYVKDKNQQTPSRDHQKLLRCFRSNVLRRFDTTLLWAPWRCLCFSLEFYRLFSWFTFFRISLFHSVVFTLFVASRIICLCRFSGQWFPSILMYIFYTFIISFFFKTHTLNTSSNLYVYTCTYTVLLFLFTVFVYHTEYRRVLVFVLLLMM